VDVDIDLGDCRLAGTVGDLYGNNHVTVSYSSLGAKHRLAGWLDALALGAGAPDENWTVHTVGRYRSTGKFALVKPVGEPEALQILRDLVDIYRRGQREPLPLPPKTSLAWAEEHQHRVRGRDADPDAKAWAEWQTPPFNDTGFPREDEDAWHVRAWGEQAPYRVLASQLRADEAAYEERRATDPHVVLPEHRLGHYAWRLWGPLLSDERELVRGIG